MSSTVLYVVAPNGDVEHRCEFKNSWGGAAAIWELLGIKYAPQPPSPWAKPGDREHWSFSADGALDNLFKLARTPDVMAPWERITLLTTADHVVVPIKHVERVAIAFETFFEHFKEQRTGCVFSVGDQAAVLRTILQDGGSRGVCWNQTTVSSALWEGCYVPNGENGDEGEYVPYNIDTMTDHWFLFEEEEAPEPSTA